MATALRRIVVVGGAGNLGKFIVNELRNNPANQVSIVTRASSSQVFDGPEKVTKVPDDYSDAAKLDEAFKDQDAVVVSLNFRGEPFQDKLVDAAIKAGVKHFIPSDFSGDAESEAAEEVFPALIDKKKIIKYLREKESTGFSWTAIITGIFIDLAIGNGFMGFRIPDKSATIWDDGNTRFSCSTRSQIAKTVAAVLANPALAKNSYVYTSSFEITQNEIVASLEKQTGGGKWEIEHVDSDDMIRQGKEGMNRGDFMSMGKLALGCTYSPKVKNNFPAEGKSWNEKLGLKSENLDQVLADQVGKAGGAGTKA